MTKLPTLSDKEVEQVLKGNGLELRRQGKHGNIWVHPEDTTRRTQVPKRDDVAPGTLGAIIRDAKKHRDEFTR